MRICFCFTIVLLFTAKLTCSEGSTTESRVKQEIRYLSGDAEEVYLVWGINNWNTADSLSIPAGSFIKDGLVYSSMKKMEDYFSIDLTLPRFSTVDYVFWITKGPKNTASDIWDKNQKPFADYHSLAANHNTVLIEPATQIQPREQLSILHYSWPFLLLVGGILGSFVYLRRKWFGTPSRNNAYIILFSSSIALFLMLLLTRPSVLGISWDIYAWKDGVIKQWLLSGYYDLVFTAVLTALFFLLLVLAQKYPRLQLFLAGSFAFFGIISVVAALLNIRVVEMLGKPFNYQWLYYSDFLQSPDSKAAISSNVNSSYVTSILVVCTAAILLGWLVNELFRSAGRWTWGRRVALTAFPSLGLIYILVGYQSDERKSWSYDRLSNPVTAFLESMNPFSENPSLFTMEIPDSLQIPEKKVSGELPKADFPSKIRNVLLFVMESTPAEYLQVYGSKYNVTPEISKWSKNGLVFEGMYAHAPATNLSMVSMLGSVYPWLSYNSLTEEHPKIEMPTLSSELAARGYRAGFFNSADNGFQRAGEFLSGRGFERISDCKNGPCNSSFSVKEDWDHMNGRDDACTARELCEWIAQEPGKPFFGMMWTYQTHYPYFMNGKESHFSDDPFFNRYLNALKHADEVFGNVMNELKKRKLLESTLVVVVGDHGEAFGRHNQLSHGRKIYEENMHVPCVFINPGFREARNPTVGGLIDIAPTIMHLLGEEPADGWQGKSLFAEGRSQRTYFFAPWSDYLFGYREGDTKYIYNATNNTTEIYDLARDPLESENLAPYLPEEVKLAHLRLAAWTQHVNKYMLTTLSARREIPLARKD